jgi:UMF1 family MFS transporter
MNDREQSNGPKRDATGEAPSSASPLGPRRATRPELLAWAAYDWAGNAFPTIVQTFVFASYFAGQVAPSETRGTTLWGNAIGLAGVVIALGGPVLGATADQLGRRKPWIAGFTWLTVAAAAALWFIRPSVEYVYPGLVLVVVGTIGSEFAMIFYNAMLPSLAPREEIGRWSGWAWGAGYVGGLACLCLALFAFVRPEAAWLGLDTDAAAHIRATFPMTAAWLLLFSLPLLLFTPDRPKTGCGLRRAMHGGLRQLRQSARDARRHLPIVRFLIARMLYVDALATIFAFGGIYARGTFEMNPSEILAFGIGLNVAAGLGALGFGWIDDWIGGKRTIVCALLGLIVPGSLLLIVTSKTLFWVFAMVLGIFVGPAQAASRSYLARVVPAPLTNQFFGLYAFSGKATAFAGPLLVGWLTAASGSQRVGMSTVIVLLVAGLALVLTLPRDGE